MERNEIIDQLPTHLKDLIIDQPYNEYTARDHAVWRYVMHQNLYYLPGIAHSSYLEGLAKTGVSAEHIPHMYGMNRILKEIGWAAVAVDGFIPPSAFMEFQAYNVLVIAADIRNIDQIGYTPAPDIIHEAAGHAPIIADKDYSAYLRKFGQIGSKAFRSQKDKKLYEAVRHLSILKADPYTTEKSIKEAENELQVIREIQEEMSELAQIRNLHWWTVEYGLIGDLKDYKIYGAGLLSSIRESFSCFSETVKKLPYSIEAARVSFDITHEQPQLFVTPGFEHLSAVLNEFAESMAFKTGGLKGLIKAIESKEVATCEFDSGIQLSGVFSEYFAQKEDVVFIKTTGPSALSINHQQIRQHGKRQHAEGFSAPLGQIKNINNNLPITRDSFTEILDNKNKAELNFASGLTLRGIPLEYYDFKGQLYLVTFDQCTIEYQNQILFKPEYGMFDLILAHEITSVFPGPADPERFNFHHPVIKEKTHKINYDSKAQKLHEIYNDVRAMRNDCFVGGSIEEILNTLINEYPHEWLIYLELLEVIKLTKNEAMYNKVYDHLWELKKDTRFKKLIEDGFEVINV
jgi:phenylalanine-4-hydroxylase